MRSARCAEPYHSPNSYYLRCFSFFMFLEPGDLIFWGLSASSEAISQAVAQSGKSTENFQATHVALISEFAEKGKLIKLIHASDKKGIVQESFSEANSRINKKSSDSKSGLHPIRAFRVQLPAEQKRRAISWADSKLGLPYNDLFSESCINSRVSESYYCCQFIRKAYQFATDRQIFPLRTLVFGDEKGNISPYWVKYFAKRGKSVPINDIGSHPQDFLSAEILEEISEPDQMSLLAAASSLSGITRSAIVRTMSSFTFPADPLKGLHFVGGRRVEPENPSHSFPVIEPATGKEMCQCPAASESDVDAAVFAGKQALPEWSQLSGFERGKILRKAADIIRANLDKIAEWEVRDNGKPIAEAQADITGCADNFEFFGGVATTVMGDYIPLSGGKNFAMNIREPLGVVGGIGAWNFPFQTASWKIAPALACGNTFVYKPSPLAPITSVILAEILTAAGLPSGAVNIIQGEAKTGEALCLHDKIAKISFTGSVGTGQKIMQLCATRGLKPITLELGGKSPLIIFEDAKIDNAVTGAMMANFFTQGEVCSNAARVFVHESIVDEFTEKLVARTKKMKIGDPHQGDTKVGATISEDHMKKVLGYIESAKTEGAKILLGGERVHMEGALKDGYFLSPCIVSGANDGMKIVQEEIFGSVLVILPFSTEAEAVARANNNPFGLAAGLFTSNLQRAHRVISKLEAGSIYCNTYNIQPPELPFGGYKMSGFGRECGMAALQHYTQVKSVLMHMEEDLEDCFS